MRLRAIICCLWFGFMPWRVYEDECHYECHYEGLSYWQHAWLNISMVWTWVSGQETEEDRRFEAQGQSVLARGQLVRAK